jgi:4-amino-4-deoxy-L-arabinose transferase-like glycosyltransferase
MSSIPVSELPTVTVPRADQPRPQLLSRWRARIQPRVDASWWIMPAHVGVIALAAVTFMWNLTVSGFANTYYSMAAQAASQSWSAWFWGSLDAANFITVDKPPLATMLMGLSVRLFGLSSWSILLPEALAGVATIALVYAIVRRQFGAAAATLAALVAALTPAAVLMFRYDNPDALLTLLLVGAAGALMRALETGRLRWVVLSAVLVGLGFNTKFMQAYLVLPAFAFVYLVVANGSLRRRVGHLAVAAISVVMASGWWVAVVELTPAATRPFIGGSTNNSALQLLLGYDGVQRILGIFGLDGPTGAVGIGTNFGGLPGLLRLFNPEFGGQISWLLPAALVGLTVGLISRRGMPRTDLRRAAYLLWGGWLIVHAVVFSFMSGIVHSYYTVAMAPAIGVLVGAGAVELWSMRARDGRVGRAARLTLGATVALTAAWAALLLARSPDFMPWLAPVVLLAGIVAALGLAVPRRPGLALAGAALALAAILAGPIAYSIDTINTAYAGGDPQAGPAVAGSTGGPGGARGPFGAPGGGVDGSAGSGPVGSPPAGVDGFGPRPGDGGGVGDGGGFPGGPGASTIGDDVIAYLKANQGDATWIVAARSANEAAAIQLATGQPVMAVGGFSGDDSALTIEQLKQLVANGQLRYVLVGNLGGPIAGGPDGGTADTSSDVFTWITEHGTVVEAVGDGSLYDVSGAATQN